MEQRGDIIIAPATLTGGAIAVLRLSGGGSVELASTMFKPTKADAKPLSESRGYTLHYGDIVSPDGEVVDDVMLSLFRAPHSYTGEDGVEISCHGSSYIVQRIIELALSGGARLATPGEFTMRAYMAGRMDLSQAEAVGDIIASTNRATLQMARKQMRGGYSEMLESMRGELVKLSALLELELDFSEEDVEFADRSELRRLMVRLSDEIERLANSFKVGNAIKNGVSVAIVGAPNAGKSTLLNRILGEDRAMVSSVAGTTRDSIEEVITLGSIAYRFIDTAGLHATTDELEQMGIERTHAAISRARIVIQLVDILNVNIFEPISVAEDQELITVFNKVDLRVCVDTHVEAIADTCVDERGGFHAGSCADTCVDERGKIHSELTSTSTLESYQAQYPDAIFISAKDGAGVDNLLTRLSQTIDLESLYQGDLIVSNARHYDHLCSAAAALTAALTALDTHLTPDLIVEDLRHTLHHIGSITGEITTHEILGHIFSSFCIGK